MFIDRRVTYASHKLATLIYTGTQLMVSVWIWNKKDQRQSDLSTNPLKLRGDVSVLAWNFRRLFIVLRLNGFKQIYLDETMSHKKRWLKRVFYFLSWQSIIVIEEYDLGLQSTKAAIQSVFSFELRGWNDIVWSYFILNWSVTWPFALINREPKC